MAQTGVLSLLLWRGALLVLGASLMPARAATAPPSVPQNVSAIELSPTTALVSWSPSSDSLGVAGYHVYRNGTLLGTSAGTNFTDNGPLNEYLSYQYTVDAYDGSANTSAQSAPTVFAYHRFPFVMPWDSGSPNSLSDLSGWAAGPASNWITVSNGHFYAGTNRYRFFGVNMVAAGAFLSHPMADTVSLRLAQLGVNCVRLHQLDISYGIWLNGTTNFDPVKLDELDYFVADLKKYGIYVDMNLHVVWEYPGFPTDGVPGIFEGIDLYYPGIIALQQYYASNLLTHINAYTGNAYAKEPAVALVEINNEDGLIGQWFDGVFTTNLDVVYRNELQTLWNTWLTAKYANNAAVTTAWAPASATPYGSQLLTNGNFASGLIDWNFVVTPPAVANGMTVFKAAPNGSNYFLINVTATNSNPQAVTLSSSAFSLTQGQAYTINFWAQANPPCLATVGFAQNYGSQQPLGTNVVQLTTNWQQMAVVIPATGTEPNACLQFSGLAQSTGAVSFANVAVTTGNTIVGSSFAAADKSGTTGMLSGESLGTISYIQFGQTSQRTRAVFQDWMQFLWSTESNYWTGMRTYLISNLGVKAPIVGTQVKYSPSPIQAQMDVIDFHPYWANPVFPGAAWDPTNWYVFNTSMSGESSGGLVSYVAQARVANKPFICTEVNSAAPNTFDTEIYLDMAAYAAQQDWDGIFAFDFLDNPVLNQDYFNNYFDVANEPAKLVTFPAVAAILRHFYIAPSVSQTTVTTTSNAAVALDQLTGSGYSAIYMGLYGVDSLLSFQQRLNLTFGPITQVQSGIRNTNLTAFTNDTGQLDWDTARGLLTISAPLVKGVIGQANQQTFNLGDGVTVTPGMSMQPSNWAAITMTVLNGAGFQATNSRILITATGYTDNQGMVWTTGEGPTNQNKCSVGDTWGELPSLMEGIPATITLAVPTNQIGVWALDAHGDRMARVPFISTNGGTQFQLSRTYGTVWYEVDNDCVLPLVVSIFGPTNGGTYLPVTPIPLAVAPTDMDGPQLTSVKLYNNGALFASMNQAPFSMVVSNLASGTYNFQAVATDYLGRTATSAVVQVIVSANLPDFVLPLAYYPLNETNGQTAHDPVGGNNLATPNASPSWQPTNGPISGCIDFTTTSQTGWSDSFYNSGLSGSAAYVTNFPLTLSAWVNTTSLVSGAQREFLWIGYDNANEYFALSFPGNSFAPWIIMRNNNYQEEACSTAIGDGKWHNVAGVFTSTTNRALYVDGVNVLTDNSECDFPYSPVDRISIGAMDRYAPVSGTDCYNGLEADVGIWPIAVTPVRIALIHAMGSFERLALTNSAINALEYAFTAGTGVVTIGPHYWQYATNLTGTGTGVIGTTGGSVSNTNAYVVLDTFGNGVEMVSPTAPTITFTPQSQTNYVGTTAAFSVSANSILPVSYQWSFGSSVLTSQTNAALILPNIQPAQAGSYSVQIVNGAGIANAAATLTVLPRPSITQPTILPGGQFQFQASAIPNTAGRIWYSPSVGGPWTVLTNITVSANGSVTFTDPQWPLAARRFYSLSFP